MVVSGDAEAARGLIGSRGIEIAAADDKAQVGRLFRVPALPSAVLIDPKGVIASGSPLSPCPSRAQSSSQGLQGMARSATPAQANAYAMIQRRAQRAEIATKIGNHTFRATGETAYLKNGGTLEKTAPTANHASTRTTKLYQPARRGSDAPRGGAGVDLR